MPETKLQPILSTISVPNASAIPCSGLTVIVGPNSSGKTQLLRDINATLTGGERVNVVCTHLDVKLGQPEPLVENLIANGEATKSFDEHGHEVISSTIPHIGVGGGGWRVPLSHLRNWHSAYQDNAQSREYLKHIGQLLVTSLFLDRRLTATNEVKNFDWAKDRPSSELQALYISPTSLKDELTQEIATTFGKAIWVCPLRGNILCLRVADGDTLPPERERLEPSMAAKHRTIETEGDGLKSYTCICMSLLLGRRPVQLIDEPEMCLHPPQAYALGRFIGKHATDRKHAAFVATHSSHLLRGIVETTRDLRILRLSRFNNQFHGKLIPYETIKACTDRPEMKAETVLDGVFAEAVTIVEAEGDRALYSTAEDNISDGLDHDMQFVSVGGLGGIASTAALYRELEIPQVVIADLDLLGNFDTLLPILNGLGAADAKSIVADARSVIQEIKDLGPRVSPDDVKTELTRIVGRPMNWPGGDDAIVRRELKALGDSLSRMAILKEGGVEVFKTDHPLIYEKLQSLLRRCRIAGLFLAPVGTLEQWEPELMQGISKRKKAEWATEASARLRARGKQDSQKLTGVHDFMAQIVQFQQDQARRYAGYAVKS